MADEAPLVRKASASTAGKQTDLERIRRMSVRERMEYALELGRRQRTIRKRAKAHQNAQNAESG